MKAVFSCLRQYSVLGIQKRVAETKRTCVISLIVLIGLDSCISLLKAESQHSLLMNENTNLKHKANAYPSSFFKKRAEGWHWYESLSESLNGSKVEEKKEGKKEKRYDEKLSPSSPTKVIETQRKALEEKLHAAILEPTKENITSYLLVQKAIMDQSQRFAQEWKKVVLATPSLDETLIHPVDQNARHIYYDEKHKELGQHIKALAKEYGLFFFFRKNCPYCHHFAPIVKRFSQKYGWSVLGISLDGGTLSEFPYAKRDNGISKRLQIAHVPALIALHPKTGQLIPLAYGMVSETELEERLSLLTLSSNSLLKRAHSMGALSKGDKK